MSKWTEVPAGEVNGAIQRFLVALGDRADVVIRLINGANHVFAYVIARYAIEHASDFPSIESLPLTVVYGRMEEQIKVEKYDGVDANITPTTFPTDQVGEVEKEALLVHFNRFMGGDEVENELEALGLRLGNLDELLAVGAKYPDKQRSFPIVAIGSAVRLRGFRYVPFLSFWLGGRRLSLSKRCDGWNDSCRFLAFCK